MHLNDQTLLREATVIETDWVAIAREETFGPLALLFRFKEDADVIAQANGTKVGLGSYFYAESIFHAFRVTDALECGMVRVNTDLVSTAAAPSGGVKSSGLGREGSKYGTEEFTETKCACLGGIS